MEKGFYKKLMAIAIPITIQNIISYSVNMMDTLMLGSFGETVLSASSLSSQVFYLFSLLISGIGSGSGVLCSQYFGKRDLKSLRKITAMALKISVIVSLIFVFLLVVYPKEIMMLFTSESNVILEGIRYLRVVSISYIFYSITTIFLIILRSLKDVKLSIWIYILSFFTNIFFNYMFIFGHFGSPRLGIVGAALGTVIARALELLLALFYLKYREEVMSFKFHMLKYFDSNLLKDMIKYGLPVILGETFWGLGLAVHSSILGHMGEMVVAASSICNVLHQFSLSFVQGIGSSTAVIIGGYIGAGLIEKAKKSTKAFLKVYILCGFFNTIFMLAISKPIFSIYTLQPETLQLAKTFLYTYAFITFFRSIVSPIIGGILWGGGDTKFSAFVDITFLWALIPFGYLAAFRWDLNPALVLIILRLETFLKLVACLIRIHGDRWIKNTTR